MSTSPLERVRIHIPKEMIKYRGKAGKFFKFLPNNQGLTEEYLYYHQSPSTSVIRVFSTSPIHIGVLEDIKSNEEKFKVINGPAIVVARKGYAGRMYLVEDNKFIVHEDAYATIPKEKYKDDIDLKWFIGHYSLEFQNNRTSIAGIGDFPRKRFSRMNIIIPKLEYQLDAVKLYDERDVLIKKLISFPLDVENSIATFTDSLTKK